MGIGSIHGRWWCLCPTSHLWSLLRTTDAVCGTLSNASRQVSIQISVASFSSGIYGPPTDNIGQIKCLFSAIPVRRIIAAGGVVRDIWKVLVLNISLLITFECILEKSLLYVPNQIVENDLLELKIWGYTSGLSCYNFSNIVIVTSAFTYYPSVQITIS